jgi:hypothetical protein
MGFGVRTEMEPGEMNPILVRIWYCTVTPISVNWKVKQLAGAPLITWP